MADTNDALRREMAEARSRGFDAFFEGQTKPWHFLVSNRQDEERLRWQRRLDAAAEPVIAALQARVAELEAELKTDRGHMICLADRIDELEAENRKGWLPIETAPEGVEIPCLGRGYDGPVMLKYYRHNGLDAWRDWDQEVYAPTHWYKLPPPLAEPSRDAQEGERG